ncbi:ABC transporter ATP-binding protein [Lysinibacillus fusiformis]|uniref:ABC transporter ATP-binding protein n=1 Tax=Lysinibacillus fusiformis TaxID=28031 RepID=UPI00380D9776
MDKNQIEVTNLSKSFITNGFETYVLKNINLKIYEGDYTIIMGSSGSGKSTLLYCLSGMDQATSGEIIYNGSRIDRYSQDKLALLRREEMGFVFQQFHLVSNLSILENIIIPGYLIKENKADTVNKRALFLMGKVGISNIGSQLPSQTSGGQQQRAAIARALINSPKILFADEPTGALNSTMGQEILDLLTTFNQEGQGILMVTHDLKAAIRADRLIYIKDGVIGGELSMSKFSVNQSKSREAKIFDWLNSMGW